MSRTEQDSLFGELYNSYRQPIYGYLYRLVGDSVHAEELVQDVFLRAYQGLLDLAQGANYRAWLYQIATNAAKDWFRRQRVRHWLPFLSARDKDIEEEPSQPDGTIEPGLQMEERLAVEQALGKLPPTYRVPLILFVIEGLSTAEVAAILGISRSGVKMRLARARVRFRDIYGAGEHAPDQGMVRESSSVP